MDNESGFKGYNSIFALRLRELMDKTTQAQLAEKIGTTRQAISQYMDGSVQPNIEKLYKISNYFNVSTDYMLGRAECTTPANEAISIETGLSEFAIMRIKQYKEMGYDGIFNYIISNIEFVSALKSISDFFTLDIKPGYHAIVPKADFEAIRDGGKGRAMFRDSSVIKKIYAIDAREHMNKVVDDIIEDDDNEHLYKREKITEEMMEKLKNKMEGELNGKRAEERE